MHNTVDLFLEYYLYSKVITINVPVVYMARYVIVFRRARSITRGMEGVGPGNRDFFGV